MLDFKQTKMRVFPTKRILAATAATLLMMPGSVVAGAQSGTDAATEFVNGYPTIAASKALYDEMDLQRATQAYIWATPLVNSMGFRKGMAEFGVTEKNHKLLLFQDSGQPQGGILTANNTTPYFFGLMDLAADGPMVVEIPAKTVLGAFVDFWMRAVGDIGPTGVDKGEGGKFLILPPGYDKDVPNGYLIINSPSNLMWVFGRFGAQYIGDPSFELVKKVLVYPLSDAANAPKEAEYVAVGKKRFSQQWPMDYGYWPLVAEGLNRDIVHPIDKVMHDMLVPLGIVHGKPFAPNERQKRILTKAADLGHRMTVNLAFNNRKREIFYAGKQWETLLTVSTWSAVTPTTVEYADRAAGWHQITLNIRYLFEGHDPVLGKGSIYLISFKDGSAAYLDGSKNYRLTVPADVPAANFWSATVYDNETRTMIETEQNLASLASTDKLKVNKDGTVDLYFGPEAPKGKKSNWIQTIPNKGWFTYFRIYGPEKEYYDKSWQLPDLKEVK